MLGYLGSQPSTHEKSEGQLSDSMQNTAYGSLLPCSKLRWQSASEKGVVLLDASAEPAPECTKIAQFSAVAAASFYRSP